MNFNESFHRVLDQQSNDKIGNMDFFRIHELCDKHSYLFFLVTVSLPA